MSGRRLSEIEGVRAIAITAIVNLGGLMKTLFLASAAVVGLFGASALAADLPTKA
jgi:hypothetical protein